MIRSSSRVRAVARLEAVRARRAAATIGRDDDRFEADRGGDRRESRHRPRGVPSARGRGDARGVAGAQRRVGSPSGLAGCSKTHVKHVVGERDAPSFLLNYNVLRDGKKYALSECEYQSDFSS